MKNMIGNTPLLEIKYQLDGHESIIYAKAEFFNLTGSIKDRMAKHIIEESYRNGTLKKGMPIVEATSGNTGIAFSALGALYGHQVNIFMPDWMSSERKGMISKYGANLHEVSKEQGGFKGSIKLADEYAEKVDGFRPRQFCNKFNPDAHYQTTGLEILEQMKEQFKVVDAFVAGVGTGGTVMGVGKRLKEANPNVLVFPLEPSNSPTLTTGHQVGKHRIQGISDEFIPSIVKLDELDEVLMVDDGDAIIMAQQLASKLGLGVGISSGANFIGAAMVHEKHGFDLNVVTIFSDDQKKYLTTDLMKEEPIKEGFYSPRIKLLDVTAICVCSKKIIQGSCDV